MKNRITAFTWSPQEEVNNVERLTQAWTNYEFCVALGRMMDCPPFPWELRDTFYLAKSILRQHEARN